jgi:3-oxoacid CoA-transferase subunit B
VHRVFTDLAVLDIDRARGFVLRETAPGVTVEQVRDATDAPVLDGR